MWGLVRGYTNFSKVILSSSKNHNLVNNINYFHDSPLAPIFNSGKCKGVLTINSSVGYQALFHDIPLKAAGIAPYNIEGLADQSMFIDFFKAPKKPNKELFKKFYKFVLENTQINGNFDGDFPFKEVVLKHKKEN